MSQLHVCPRRSEVFSPDDHTQDTWREDGSCSFCGSMNPDTFMERLEAGDVRLAPTDKNYKVYVENEGGTQFKQTYRDCSGKECNKGPDECTHWVTREVSHSKFYFQHLSDEQKDRFITLLNEKKLKLGYPGYFYSIPFFCRIIARSY